MSLTTILFAVGCQTNEDWQEMPHLPLYSANGTATTLADYHEGAPLAVNFYDKDCEDCVTSDEITAWNSLEQHVDVLGVLVDFDQAGTEAYIGWGDYLGMNYNTRIANPEDYAYYLAALYNAEMPDELPSPLIHVYNSDTLLGREYEGTLLDNEDKMYRALELENQDCQCE